MFKKMKDELLGPAFASPRTGRVAVAGVTSSVLVGAVVVLLAMVFGEGGFLSRPILAALMGSGACVGGSITSIGVAMSASETLQDMPGLATIPAIMGSIIGSFAGVVLLPVFGALLFVTLPATATAKAVYPPAHDGPQIVSDVDDLEEELGLPAGDAYT